MATNLAELRHYYSLHHGLVRQNLVKSLWFLFVGKKCIDNNINQTECFAGWEH